MTILPCGGCSSRCFASLKYQDRREASLAAQLHDSGLKVLLNACLDVHLARVTP